MSETEKVSASLGSQPTYRFQNICGATYSGGSLVFGPGGKILLSPVGNRVAVIDLVNNKTRMLPAECRSDCSTIALSPDGTLALCIDKEGYAQCVSLAKGIVVNRINFKQEQISQVKFSPNGRYIALARHRKIQVWEAPSAATSWKLVLVRELAVHIDSVKCLSWAADSSAIVSGGADMLVRVTVVDRESELRPASLAHHHQPVMGAFFDKDMKTIFSVSRSGVILQHRLTEDGEWVRGDKFFASPNAVADQEESQKKKSESGPSSSRGAVSHVDFHSDSGTLLVGHVTGAFSLYQLPEMTALQTLAVGVGTGKSAVSNVCLSPGGEWLAVGIKDLGQLLVWEWRAETQVLKQQGHLFGVRAIAFSAGPLRKKGGSVGAGEMHGSLMATGGLDGKVKLWHSASGFCYQTFTDHSASVEALCFSPQGNAVLSASRDGSVRAYDLLRYRNFRTLVTAQGAKVQFGSLCMDAGGDIVCAGAVSGGNYSVYLWALATGQQLDVLAGHTARVSGVAFSPEGGLLASASWDKTIRVWEVFGRAGGSGGSAEVLSNTSQVTCLEFSPKKPELLAASTLAGQIVFWDTKTGAQTGSIDGIRDIVTGRRADDKFHRGALKGKKTKRDGSGLAPDLNQYFSVIKHFAGGDWLLAASSGSPVVCIYDTDTKALLSRYVLTTNNSLTGLKPFLNSKFDPLNANGQEMDKVAEEDRQQLLKLTSVQDYKRRRIAEAQALPGVKEAVDFADFSSQAEWNCHGVAISSDSSLIGVASSHGAFVLANIQAGAADVVGNSTFLPRMLTEHVTSTQVTAALAKTEFARATVLALALGEVPVARYVIERIPKDQVRACVAAVSPQLLPSLVALLAECLTPHVERMAEWLLATFDIHFPTAQALLSAGGSFRESLLSLQSALSQLQAGGLGREMRDNMYTLEFLQSTRTAQPASQ